MSVFDEYRKEAWPLAFRGRIRVEAIHGGIPSDPKVAEGWLRSKLDDPGSIIRDRVAEVIADRATNGDGVNQDEIIRELAAQNVNGFRRDPDTGHLFIEGRQLKAALKEGASVAIATDKLKAKGWGKTNKGLLSFMAEHIVVLEDKLFFDRDGEPVTEPEGVHQRFVHTWRGSSISYEEFLTDVEIEFTLLTDFDWSERDWAMVWLTAEPQGIGASRSQGYGRFTLVEWEAIDAEAIQREAEAA